MLSYFFAFAQEICNNGFDDNNNSYIDCYDTECMDTQNCMPLFIVEDNSACDTSALFQFAMDLVWTSPNFALINDLNQVLAADLDNDGSVEVFAVGQNNSFISGASNTNMYVFDGSTGNVEQTFTFPDKWDGQTMPAIGDVDNDGLGEIIVSSRQSNSTFSTLYVFESNGAIKYSLPIPNYATNRTNDWAIADFDQNGTSEIYTRGVIVDGANGIILMALPEIVSATSPILPHRCSVAVDILPDSFCGDCQGLELVIGNKIYSVNLMTGSALLQVTAAGYGLGFTSIADWDLDGDFDVLVYDGEFGSSFNGLYVWDGQTSSILGNFPSPDGLIGARVCIGNVDDDPHPEAIYKTLEYLYVVDNDFTLIWQTAIDENGTGMTPATLFDFDGDGKMEVVHRDENSLEVYSGNSGSLLDEYTCYSITGYEVVIIADANGDGKADILTACNTNPSSISNSNEGHVRLFQSAASPWMPARSVWNQHGYFNVNINNDLSIPKQQQQHHLQFPQGSNNYPFNTFMAQFGPQLATNNANNLANATGTISSVCVNGTVTYEICNQGDATLPAGTPVAIYNANPTVNSNATLLQVDYIASELSTGDCLTMQYISSTADSIFILANFTGLLQPPFTLDELIPNNLAVPECEPENNLSGIALPGIPVIISTSYCQDGLPYGSLQVIGNNSLTGFTWSNGMQTETIQVTQSGTFCVSVTDTLDCVVSVCADIDQLIPPMPQIYGDTLIAEGASGQLGVLETYPAYLWSTGATASSISVNVGGIYTITVTDQNGCTAMQSINVAVIEDETGNEEEPTDTLDNYRYIIPLAFTPNQDGVNDVFTAFTNGQVTDFVLFVYNRWGNKVFESHNPIEYWDGTYQNSNAPIGVYVYYGYIAFANGDTYRFKGNVTLLR